MSKLTSAEIKVLQERELKEIEEYEKNLQANYATWRAEMPPIDQLIKELYG